MQGGATLPCAPPFHAAPPPPCPAGARIEPERHPARVDGAYADFRYVDVMFPPPGADRCAWERIDVGDLARRVAACGARPGFATVQRFRSPAPLEDEPRLTGLYFDFDDKENPERALADAARLVRWFAETGLPWSAFRIEFSGNRGAHVTIEPGVFAIAPRPDLHKIVGAVARWLADRLQLATLDLLVYGARRQWRLADTRHPTSGLYCVEITPHDLAHGLARIQDMARAPRGPLYDEGDRSNGEHADLAAWYRSFVEAHDAQEAAERDVPRAEPASSGATPPIPSGRVDEVVNLLAPYYVEGRRHHFALAVSGFLLKSGVDEAQVEVVIERLAARDRERGDRRAAVRSTVKRRSSGKRVAGHSALAAFVPAKVLAKLEAALAPSCPEFQHPEAPRIVSLEEAEAELSRDVRAALDAPAGTITVINAAPGVGKTAATIQEARDYPRPVAYFAREHDLLEEVLDRAKAQGVDVAKWPRLDDDTCPEKRADEISALYGRGFDGTAAICVSCPRFPKNGGDCPRIEEIMAVGKAQLRLIPVAALRPSGARLRSELEVRERYAHDAAIVFDEDPTQDLARSLTVTRGSIEAFRALLDEAIEGGGRRRQGVTLDLFTLSSRVREALAVFDTILESPPPECGESRVVDLASAPCPKVDLDAKESASVAVKLDRLLSVTAAESTRAAGATNLLPLALRAAHHAHMGAPLRALRREDRLELEVLPRPRPDAALTILDATASAEVLRGVFPGFQVRVTAPITLERPAGARLIQYVDRSFSRRSLEEACEIERAASAIGGAIRLHVKAPERPTLGLVTYKHLVEPLGRAIAAEVEDVQLVGSLHFGAVRGKNTLEGVDVLVVLGTPRPHPATTAVRALAIAAEGAAHTPAPGVCADRGRVEVLGYGGKRVRRFRGAEEGPFAIAEEHAISAELLQAIGRQRLERHGGVTLLFTSWPLPLAVGAVEVRSVREDGLVMDARRATAYEAFEQKLVAALSTAPAGLTSAEVAAVVGVDRRHLGRYFETFLARSPEYAVDRSARPPRLKRRTP